MKKIKIATKLLSFFMAVLILFYSVPAIVYAESADAISSLFDSEEIETTSSEAKEKIERAYEVEELRTENTKTFKIEGGAFVAAQYPTSVHKLSENGKWEDINNKLNQSGSEYTTSDARIKFAKKITGNASIFTLHENNKKITLALEGANKKATAKVINGVDTEKTDIGKLMYLENISSTVFYEDILAGVDIEYVISGNNIKENIIVKERKSEYVYSFVLSLNNLSAGLSDSGDVLISDSSGKICYTIPAPIIYDANGAYADLNVGKYELKNNQNGSYELTVTVSSEWMNDSSRAFPVTVDPTIDENWRSIDDTSISSASPSSDLGNDTILYVSSSRKIHIKLDWLPNIPTSAYISKATVLLKSTAAVENNYVAAYEVLTDWDDTLTWNQHTNATNPKGKLSNTVIDYQLISSVGVYSWDITPIAKKWHEGENYGVAFSGISGQSTNVSFYSSEYGAANHPAIYITYYDMKGLENYWSYSTQEAGIAGSGNVNLATGELTFSIPTLSTTDELMPYTPTLIYNSSLANMMYTKYNATTMLEESYLSYGFKLNTNQYITNKNYVYPNGETKKAYVYSDADGTEHVFYLNEDWPGFYEDEDGLGLRLQWSEFSYSIFDDSKFVKVFPDFYESIYERYLMTGIVDRNGNSLSFYSSYTNPSDGQTNIILNHVALSPLTVDEPIEMLKIGYSSESGKLVVVYNPSSKDLVVLKYSDTYDGVIYSDCKNYLRQIIYAHGNSLVTDEDVSSFASGKSNSNFTVDATATYEYDSSGRITSVYDSISNQKIVYTWGTSGVSNITRYAVSQNYKGESISISYGFGYTDVREPGNDENLNTDDDIITRYVFDERGRSKSVYSFLVSSGDICGAQAVEYEPQDRVKNNLSKSTEFGGEAVNYILNGDFEQNTAQQLFEHWTVSGNITRLSSGAFDGDGAYCAAFSPSANTTASLTQYLSLKSGTYTLSMPYRTISCKNAVASVSISSTTGSGFSHTERISLSENYANGVKSAFSTTFTIPSYVSGGDKVKLVISVKAGSTAVSRVEFDRIMLEKNNGASSYNLVSYGGFEVSGLSASGTQTPISNYWTADASSSTPNVVSSNSAFGNSLKLFGMVSGKRYARQRIFSATADELAYYGSSSYYSTVGKDYIVSGYALAENAVYSNVASFRIRVDVAYYQGANNNDVIKSYSFDFIPSCKTWQLAGGSFSTEYVKESGDTADYSCVRYIDVYCEYSNQPNGYALFDNVAVINADDSNLEKYTYYTGWSLGGLLKTKENLFYKEYYEYDDNRNLTRVANNNGELIDYTYTVTNNIEKSVEYTFVVNGGGYNYPINSADPNSLITKIRKLITEYTYDAYGLCLSVLARGGPDLGEMEYICKYITDEDSVLFGALEEERSNDGVTTRYYYDDTKARLIGTFNPNTNSGVRYTYDSIGNLSGVYPVSIESEITNPTASPSIGASYSYNSRMLLTGISTESTDYSFTYDAFGNLTSVKAGSQLIATYRYNDYDGKLNKIIYSNGSSEEYVYNDLDYLKEIWYNDNTSRSLIYGYEYTAYGQLYKFTDYANGRTKIYKYDSGRRLVAVIEYDNEDLVHDFSAEIFYNEKGQHSTLYYNVNYPNGTSAENSQISYFYNYRTDGNLNSISISTPSDWGNETYTYDSFDRVIQRTRSFTGFTNQVSYSYDQEIADRSSTNVSAYTSIVNNTTVRYDYSYDGNGNITKIAYSNGKQIRYYYDNLGQLVREDNGIRRETYVYEYDDSGNIVARKTHSLTAEGATPSNAIVTYNMSYATSAWGDRLVSSNGTTITYDEIGNPLNYYNGVSYTFSWQGRNLKTSTVSGNTVSYTYNDEGIRTSKTVGNVKTTYYLSGSAIVGEETNGNVTLYIYDAAGSPIGMQYHASNYGAYEWKTFWFEKNLQGDIVAIYDETGAVVVKYDYNAWGKCSATQYNSSSPANNNPFRYRGYYYDKETAFYYLGTRYYDPSLSRFISPDDTGVLYATPNGLTDKNLYAYCDNNPVMRVDSGGEFWHIIVGGLVSGVINMAFEGFSNLIEGKDFFDGAISSFAFGAMDGALHATGFGKGKMVFAHVAMFMAEDVTRQLTTNGTAEFNVASVLKAGGSGLLSGLAGGAGNGSRHMTRLGTQTVSRTFNATKHKGIRAGIKEMGKAFAYYGKKTKSYYQNYFFSEVPDMLKSSFISMCVQ